MFSNRKNEENRSENSSRPQSSGLQRRTRLTPTNQGSNTNSNSSRPPFNKNRKFSNKNANTGPKTNSVTSETPEFIKRRDYGDEVVNFNPAYASVLGNLQPVRNVKHTNLAKGNLAASHLNQQLIGGPRMLTNSPEFFPQDNPVVRFIPIGGSNEVGLNMNAIECGDDIILIDTGMGFGDNDQFPGVDLIVPDVSYLEQNKHRIKGLIYTHGHLDHIGAAPYLLPKLGPVPIYAMPLTLALLKNRISEFDIEHKFIAKIIDLNQTIELGSMKVNFFRLNHSIPDVVGISIDTPMGRIIFCTDWKFDETPYDNILSDYASLSKFGSEGVRLLLTDSLGVLKAGKSISEWQVKNSMLDIIKGCKERVIVTSFASTIPRMQFTIDACIKNGRKLGLVGRSMINNFNICAELGYLAVPKGLIVDLHELNKLPSEKVCMLMTGSQGEDLAALTRLARDEHDLIRLQAGDSVIFSSRPIQGNEAAVERLIASLSRKGVEVYSSMEYSTHVSGHACQEDLKLLFALTKPAYIQPLHGNHFIIRKTAELAMKMGIDFDHCLLSENGRVTELRYNEVVVTDEVVNDKYLLVDGHSVGMVSEPVLEERRTMGTQGSVVLVVTINKAKKIVAGPELISRGFVYAKNGNELFEIVKDSIRQKMQNVSIDPESSTYFTDLRNSIKNIATEVIFEKTEKTPMIIPVVVQL